MSAGDASAKKDYQERAYRCIAYDASGAVVRERTIHAFSDHVALERAGLFFRCHGVAFGEVHRGHERIERVKIRAGAASPKPEV